MKYTALMLDGSFHVQIMDLRYSIFNEPEEEVLRTITDFEDIFDCDVHRIDAEMGALVIALEHGKHYIVVASEYVVPFEFCQMVHKRGQIRLCYLDEDHYITLFQNGFDLMLEQPICEVSEIVEIVEDA